MHAFAAFAGGTGFAFSPPISFATPRIGYHDFPSRRAISFRHFVAVPASRMLLRRGVPVEIGGRAFDLLLVLLRARGELVSKEEIIRHVWPSTCVEECNLRFQMAMLRRVLGGDRDLIKTVTGRGYLIADERP